MTEEQDRAQFLQAHKDDPELWGKADPHGEGEEARRPLGVSITVRFSSTDATRIRELAQESGVGYSEVVRRAVATFLGPRFEVHGVGTNYWYMAGSPTAVAYPELVPASAEPALAFGTLLTR